jgi:hypothetical protein
MQWIPQVVQSVTVACFGHSRRDYPAVLDLVEALRRTPTRFAGLRASTTSPRSGRKSSYGMAEKSGRELM